MSNHFVRSALALAVFAGLYAHIATQPAKAAAGETALSRCVDAVVQACNKKKDASVNPCVDSGISQCEKQHKAQIQLPGNPRPSVNNFRTDRRN